MDYHKIFLSAVFSPQCVEMSLKWTLEDCFRSNAGCDRKTQEGDERGVEGTGGGNVPSVASGRVPARRE